MGLNWESKGIMVNFNIYLLCVGKLWEFVI